MEKLLIPQPQPNFPNEDVNEVNAEIFSQLLYEGGFIETAHDEAERGVEAFRIGHQMLKSLSLALYMDKAQKSAFSYGSIVYEALSITVRPVRPVRQLLTVREKTQMMLGMQYDPFAAAIELRDREEQLLEEAPVTSGLLLAAAELYPLLDSRFVLMGAALERSVDKETLPREAA